VRENWDGVGGQGGWAVGDIMAVADDSPENGASRGEGDGKRRRRGDGGRPHGDLQERTGQKRRGEIAEGMFLVKMVAMGYSVMTPWGDSDKYDVVVDTGRRLMRVQVKSAHCVSANGGGGYNVRAHPHERRSYRVSEIDLLVVCIVPLEIWYVFPPGAFRKMKSMRLFPVPGRKGSKFGKYREAWGWLEVGEPRD
jgi:PD-(D/E)XK endonuclease